jgi:hypothetical protein
MSKVSSTYWNLHSNLWVPCAKALTSESAIKKLVVTGESREPIVTLPVELATNREACRRKDMPK